MSSLSTSELDQRIHAALDAAKMALWELDITRGLINWTGQLTPHFLEFSKNFDGTMAGYLALVHKDDQADVLELIGNAAKGQSFVNHHRIKFPDGNYHWVEGIGNVVVGSDGIKMTGTVQDISERKRIEFESESWKEKFQLVAKSGGILVYDHDLKTGTTRWNGETHEILGYKESELEHEQVWRENIHPDDFELLTDQLDEAKRKGDSFDIVYRYKTKSQGYVFMRDMGVYLDDGSNSKTRILGMMENVNDLHESQEALIESESRFKSMIEDLNIGVTLYDAEMKPILCNRTACVHAGMTYEQLMGMEGADEGWKVVNDEGVDLKQEEYPIVRAVMSGEPVRDSIMGIYRPKTKDWAWVMIDAEPIFDSGGNLRHIITTGTNITALRMSQQGLKEKNEMLNAMSRELKGRNERLLEFAQIVSHNLRSPISSIVALMRIYKEADQETKDKVLYHIEDVSNKALDTIGNLNDVLKVQQQTAKAENLDFKEVFDSILAAHQGLLTVAKVAIKENFKEKEISYPRIYLESVFMNLLSNSIKYRAVGRTCRVNVETWSEDGNVILKWQDNGIGIDLETHGNDIFEMGKTFHDNDDSRGIGLFLIRNQIRSLGGTITVESEVGKGTIFTINFGTEQTNEQ